MTIIYNTTPLRYLVEIEETQVLEELFGNVIIPQAVFDELQDPRTPLKVKAWMQSRPAWLELRQADISIFTPQKMIGEGEREALALALELKADAVLMDDKGATLEARRLNIRAIPTFFILEQAAEKNLLDLPQAIEKMKQTGFYPPPEVVIQAMLERDRQRREAKEQ